MNNYAILSVTHPDYANIIINQSNAFHSQEGATNYKPVLNLAGTQALIKIYTDLPESDCILSQGGDEVPASRTMSEWAEPII